MEQNCHLSSPSQKRYVSLNINYTFGNGCIITTKRIISSRRKLNKIHKSYYETRHCAKISLNIVFQSQIIVPSVKTSSYFRLIIIRSRVYLYFLSFSNRVPLHDISMSRDQKFKLESVCVYATKCKIAQFSIDNQNIITRLMKGEHTQKW